MANKIDGFGVAAIGFGAVFVYGGIKGYSPLKALTNVIKGANPNAGQTNTLSLTNTTDTTSGATSGGNAGSNSAPVGNPSTYQQYAFSQFSKYGWGTSQQQPLVNLWNQESGWNSSAQNPSSTAYGIAQFLDTTWANYGPKTSNWQLQITYGLEYIHKRYGSPAMAWAHEQANNWY